MKFDQQTSLSRLARLTLIGLALSPVALLAQQPDATPAQDGPPPPSHGQRMDPAQRQARMLDKMTQRLNLSPDQVTQIKTIQTDNETQMQSLHSDTSLKGADRRNKMMEIHKAENDKVRAVLNNEQKTKFDAMEAHRHEHMRGGDGEQGPPSPPPAQ